MALALAVPIQTQMASKGLTDVPGIKVGHVIRAERPTGCTVILAEAGAVAGVDVRGSAPGTIETDLLNPVNLIQHVHAVFLSGGSAFGLDVATGVRKYLYERQIGFETRFAKVPIVPGAIMFDLGVGGKPDIWPTADCGYRCGGSGQRRSSSRGQCRCRRWCNRREVRWRWFDEGRARHGLCHHA